MTTTATTTAPTRTAAAKPEAIKRVPFKYRAMVRRVRDLEVVVASFTDPQLKAYIHKVRSFLRDGDSPDTHLPRVFAAVCVVARRTVAMRPYNVQLVGGYELHRGCIAEMATGEGKTLVATLPAVLNGLTGKGVHVVTVNDYLAKRDAESMAPIYAALGLSVGIIVSGMSDDDRRLAYRCDVVYGTNKEFGFDYLRDQIKIHQRQTVKPIDTLTLLNRRDTGQPVQRQLNYAIVDEADSILIDESRTPLVIAGPTAPSPMAWAYEWADQLAQRLRPRHDFDLKIDRRQLNWTDHGRARLQRMLHEHQTPSVAGENWQQLVLQALRARWLFAREQHYVLTANEVVIVDEFTGRRMPGRTWNEGLHQAVQAKEKLPIMKPSETLARTTYQHFFSLYEKLSGMTGTAGTERAELKKVYKLSVRKIPTHRPVRRAARADQIFRTRREKWHAVVDEIEKTRLADRPVLVGTSNIEDSETLSAMLKERAIAHETLNAKPENAGREAQIIKKAGQRGSVTIATNMAGRGTDIKLGVGVATAGGLHVVGTQRHESRRVDNQLIGRCGRQGDPGSYVFMLSLQDPLLQHMLNRRKIARLRRRQRIRYGQAIQEYAVRRLFAVAQRKVERIHHRMRQQLMDYEDWLNKVFYQMGSQ